MECKYKPTYKWDLESHNSILIYCFTYKFIQYYFFGDLVWILRVRNRAELFYRNSQSSVESLSVIWVQHQNSWGGFRCWWGAVGSCWLGGGICAHSGFYLSRVSRSRRCLPAGVVVLDWWLTLGGGCCCRCLPACQCCPDCCSTVTLTCWQMRAGLCPTCLMVPMRRSRLWWTQGCAGGWWSSWCEYLSGGWLGIHLNPIRALQTCRACGIQAAELTWDDVGGSGAGSQLEFAGLASWAEDFPVLLYAMKSHLCWSQHLPQNFKIHW